MASWIGVGYWMIFLIAGIRDIPEDVLEAASIDGAGPVRSLFSIVLPLLVRPLAFVVIANTVANFLQFVPAAVLTQGGPAGFDPVHHVRGLQRGLRAGRHRARECGDRARAHRHACDRRAAIPRLEGTRLRCRFGPVVVTALGALVALCFAAPAFWMVTSSLRPNAEIFAYLSPLSIWSIIPRTVTFDNIIGLFEGGFGRAHW